MEYSDGTPEVNYTYDETAVPYGKGRLTKAANGYSTTAYSNYDPLGRLVQSTQTTGGQTYGFGYSYDLTGALRSETYPSGRVITTQYDKAERPVSVTGAWNSQQKTYVSDFSYAPHGGPNWFLYGNNVCRAFTYNSRLQPWTMINSVVHGAVPAGDCTYPGDERMVQVFDWGTANNNGNLNVATTSHGISGNPFLTYKDYYFYDSVNRISNVSGTDDHENLLWLENFQYDRYENAWTPDMLGLGISGITPRTNVFTSGNQFSMGSYDAAGNQMCDRLHFPLNWPNSSGRSEDLRGLKSTLRGGVLGIRNGFEEMGTDGTSFPS
jgi:YD repeat-containing protein